MAVALNITIETNCQRPFQSIYTESHSLSLHALSMNNLFYPLVPKICCTHICFGAVTLSIILHLTQNKQNLIF